MRPEKGQELKPLILQDHPDLVRDQFWEEQYPELPYTAASEDTKNVDPCEGATAKVEVSDPIVHCNYLNLLATDVTRPPSN